MKNPIQTVKRTLQAAHRALLVMAAFAVALSPTMMLQSASAAQVTSRSVNISSAQAAATGVVYTMNFVPAGTTSPIQSLKFESCTTALGTCTAPTGFSFSSATWNSRTGTWTNATDFSVNAGSNNCTAAAGVLCLTRTAAGNETTAASRGVKVNGVVNQNATNCSSAANCTFFIRMTSYSDTAFLTAVDTGTMASSTTQLLSINATIQEELKFCVGSTTVDDGTSASPMTVDCTNISGTSLNLGNLTSSGTNVSPVPAGGVTSGDAKNGVVTISTNASTGASVTYDAFQDSTGTNHQGALRVTGATCNAGNVFTDQCIDSVGTTQATITKNTEKFGMTVASVLCPASPAYTCTYAGGTYHMTRNANYDGTGANTYPTADAGQISAVTSAGYAWDETGTAAQIASSTTAVDREAMILKFAATPNTVTPTGSYLAKADFVATPTF